MHGSPALTEEALALKKVMDHEMSVKNFESEMTHFVANLRLMTADPEQTPTLSLNVEAVARKSRKAIPWFCTEPQITLYFFGSSSMPRRKSTLDLDKWLINHFNGMDGSDAL